jgi:hypothetical protein
MSQTRSSHIPFANLTPEAWRRLGLVAIFTFYILNFLFVAANTKMWISLGNDFLAFWSTGKIADEYGYDQVYDIEILTQVQNQILDPQDDPGLHFQPIPTPYFSLFIIPFQLLSKLNIKVAFFLWTIANLILFLAYLAFFIKSMARHLGGNNYPLLLGLSVIISYPVFINFFSGQIEVLLVICAGEMIRSAVAKKPAVAGAWLAGFLLKPQILILILPALLLMKNWKSITGFLLASAGILIPSLALSGFQGLISMISLWFNYVPGIASNSPQAMANWRMLAININHWTNSSAGWVVAGIGMAATLIICIMLCRKNVNFGSKSWGIQWMGIFAASLAFTWHSHLHMMMALIPFILFCALNFPEQKNHLLDPWVYPFPMILLIGYLMLQLIILNVIPAGFDLAKPLLGLTGLGLNLYIAFFAGKILSSASDESITVQ